MNNEPHAFIALDPDVIGNKESNYMACMALWDFTIAT